MTKSIITTLLLVATIHTQAQIMTNEGISYLMNQPKDMSADFSDLSNTYFFADSLADFNAAKAEGKVKWNRYRIAPRQAFNTNGFWPQRLVSYTHLRAHETVLDLVCRLLLEKKKKDLNVFHSTITVPL